MNDMSYFGRSLWYDRAGKPIDTYTFTLLHMINMNYVRVARTTVVSAADPMKAFDVSTVWLGMDHGWGQGAPIIFETMVFAEGSEDLDCRRYATEPEARIGHQETVTVVAATLDDPVIMDTTEQFLDPADNQYGTAMSEQPETETYTEWRLAGQPDGGYPPYDFTAREDRVKGLRMIWGKIQTGEYPWKDATFTSRQVTIARTPWTEVQLDDADATNGSESG